MTKKEAVKLGKRGGACTRHQRLLDIILPHYDRKFYEDMVLVARLDGGQIPLKHQKKIGKYLKMPPTDAAR